MPRGKTEGQSTIEQITKHSEPHLCTQNVKAQVRAVRLRLNFTYLH